MGIIYKVKYRITIFASSRTIKRTFSTLKTRACNWKHVYAQRIRKKVEVNSTVKFNVYNTSQTRFQLTFEPQKNLFKLIEIDQATNDVNLCCQLSATAFMLD